MKDISLRRYCVAIPTSMRVRTMLLKTLSVLLAWVYDAKIQVSQNFKGPIINLRTRYIHLLGKQGDSD